MNDTENVIERYQRYMRRCHRSAKTIDVRTTIARAVLRQHGLGGLTPDALADFLSRDELKSGWSKTTYYGHLRDLCEFLVVGGYLDENPMDEVERPPTVKSLPRPLSEGDIARVFAATDSDDMRDWMTLALYAGMRVHEIAKLRGMDVNVDGIRIVGKGRVEAVLPCHSQVMAIAERRNEPGYWWPGSDEGHIRSQQISLRVGRLFRSLGLSGSCHRLRHSYGTRLLRQGVNIRRVQTLMRHANLETTAIYTAVDENELRSAIDLLPPLPPVA